MHFTNIFYIAQGNLLIAKTQCLFNIEVCWCANYNALICAFTLQYFTTKPCDFTNRDMRRWMFIVRPVNSNEANIVGLKHSHSSMRHERLASKSSLFLRTHCIVLFMQFISRRRNPAACARWRIPMEPANRNNVPRL
jgi:hypothetical protein